MTEENGMKYSELLFYTSPASAWTQALPIGNGTLGAMIYGGVKRETLALNHDELWTGRPKDTSKKGAPAAFEKAPVHMPGNLLFALVFVIAAVFWFAILYVLYRIFLGALSFSPRIWKSSLSTSLVMISEIRTLFRSGVGPGNRCHRESDGGRRCRERRR